MYKALVASENATNKFSFCIPLDSAFYLLKKILNYTLVYKNYIHEKHIIMWKGR